MKELNDRVLLLIKALGVSKNQFAKAIGTSSTMISKITNQNTNFGVDIIERIISTYPQLNINWFISGIGEIFVSNHNYEPQEHPQLATHSNENAGVQKEKENFKKEAKIIEKNKYRLFEELRNAHEDLNEVYNAVRRFEGISDKVSLIGNTYFSDLDFIFIWGEKGYLKDGQFDYQAYKKDVLEQLEKLKPFKQSISNLLAAVEKFEAEFKAVDDKNVIDKFK